MDQFKEGDTVRLKSGGPTMTVASVSQSAGVECHWFNHTDAEWTSKWVMFQPAMLKAVSPS